ncbi:MAG: hypothetical protein MUO67_00970 [Anaerolineales bacterium]|nr:hypothetical protein [Anaerolineales bacterium]
MKNDNIKRTIRRTRGYWYVDGLWEIGYGCLFTVMGALLYLQAAIPSDSEFADLLGYAFLFIIIGLIVLINWAVRKAKEHLTYPRTGMLTYRRDKMSTRTWLLAALIAVVSILAGSLLVALFQVRETSLESIPLLLGFTGAAPMFFVAYPNNLKRFYLLAVYSILLSFLLAWAGITDMTLMGVYFTLLGIGLAVSGGITLWNYVHQTSPPQEVPNEA